MHHPSRRFTAPSLAAVRATPSRSTGPAAGLLLLVLGLVVVAVSVAPVPAAADGLPTQVSLLTGHPDPSVEDRSGVLVVPGTVIPLSAAARSPRADVGVLERHGRELAGVAARLEDTLRLSSVRVVYDERVDLELDDRRELPSPSATSAIGVAVELVGFDERTASYRIVFRDAGKTLADTPVTVERGGRAIVGGLDGEEAPYLFLVVQPEPRKMSPHQLEDGFTPPRKLTMVTPSYTEEARKERLQGVVILRTTIDREGRVTDVEVLKGLPMGLSEAAVEAVRGWTFEPARDASGEPVEVYYNLTINFTLADEEEEETAS